MPAFAGEDPSNVAQTSGMDALLHSYNKMSLIHLEEEARLGLQHGKQRLINAGTYLKEEFLHTCENVRKLGFHRTPYLLDATPRPLYRGQLFGWFYRSNVWLLIGVVYVMKSVMGGVSWDHILLQMGFVAAVQWNLSASDKLHNADYYREAHEDESATRRRELDSYRQDIVSISCILTMAMWKWSSRCSYANVLGWGVALSVVCTLVMVAMAFTSYDGSVILKLYPSVTTNYLKASERIRKCVLGIQYGGILGYLTYTALCFEGQMKGVGAIFFVYLPGMFAYTLKAKLGTAFPNVCMSKFGGHEIFHFFIMAGHISTITMDTMY
eukprot:m.97452 g.97452  ORF g.97452 m.97452 type:complete len:325 (+) comp16698_c0_seq1:97-1071(+)